MIVIVGVGFGEHPFLVMHAGKLRDEARERDGERLGHGELQHRVRRGRHLGEIERMTQVAVGS